MERFLAHTAIKRTQWLKSIRHPPACAFGFAANIDLSSLDGFTGFKLSGVAAFEISGSAVASAGDANGDGFADLIVGAPFADPNGSKSGASYVIFGVAPPFAVDRTGSSASQTLAGGAGDDTLSGLGGNDRLYGNGGDDNLDGGAGTDTAVFSGAHVEYSLTVQSGPAGRSLTLTDLRSGSPDGTDTLTGVENLQFSDGTLTLPPPNIDLSGLDGSTGFELALSGGGTARTGFSVASAGDVNGDGFADLIVGTVGGNASYVVFGKASGFAAHVDLSSLSGSNGFKLSGVAGDLSGRSVASAGDINGDGFADLIIGASYASPNGTGSGTSYVVFGKASGFAANIDLSSLNGSNGFKLSGVAAGDQSGTSVASAGDINGDGFTDLIVGAPLADPNGTSSGASYVVFGKATGFAANINLSSLDGSNGFTLSGIAGSDFSGRSVASAGDVNGDGFADLIIGAYGGGPHGSYSGASYVVFGKASGFGASLDLSSLNGSTGFKLSGVAVGNQSSVSVASAGDVNGDGFADLIVGAKYADPHGKDSGASYVVFGKATGFAANIDLPSLDGSTGFMLSGVATLDQSGYSVASAGDVNGDGFADLIVGAPGAAPYSLRFGGAGYVVFGVAPSFPVNLTGTAASQTLAGGADNDTLSGLGGNDRLYGNGGDDILAGGAGDDTLIGGTGRDVFGFNTALNAATNIDQVTDFDTASDRIWLDPAIFTGLAHGALPAGAFYTGAAAHDADDRILYDPVTGALRYDPDGNGAGVATQFATLAAGLAPTEANFTATNAVPCYCRGTLILTAQGEVPVEELAIGDRLITRSGDARPIRWVGRRGYNGRFVAGNRDVLPICITRDAIMKGVPARDLWVSPEHSLYIDDVLVQAKHLINGVTVVQVASVDEIEYFHIELDSHDVIYADGAPAETFVDCDNRLMFVNGGQYGLVYPDDDRPRWHFCAPRLEWGSPELVTIRQWMFDRAPLYAGIVEDPALILVADSIVIAPIRVSDVAYRFELPSRPGSVWLRSHAHIAAERDPASFDTRRLGVPVAELVLASGEQTLKVRHWNPLLRQGFHAAESTHRWTDGAARIPDEMLRAFQGPLTIRVTLAQGVRTSHNKLAA